MWVKQKFLLVLMGSGQSGALGLDVVVSVAAGYRPIRGLVLTLHLQMVGNSALDSCQRVALVFPVDVLVTGQTGVHGRDVQMVIRFVLGGVQLRNVVASQHQATHNHGHAQVSDNALSDVLFGWVSLLSSLRCAHNQWTWCSTSPLCSYHIKSDTWIRLETISYCH